MAPDWRPHRSRTARPKAQQTFVQGDSVLLASASILCYDSESVIYSISELVRKTGQTQRNIRYYVELGLIPSPEGTGRGARYGEEHVALLRQIRDLQAAGYKLSQIGERLASPSAMRLRRRTPAREESNTSRAGYELFDTERLKGGGGRPTPPDTQTSDPGAAGALLSARLTGAPEATPSPPRTPESSYEHWRRVRITRDIELHLRGRSAGLGPRLERALRMAIRDAALEDEWVERREQTTEPEET